MNRFINALGKSVLTILIILLIGYGWAFFEMKILLKSNPELFGYVFYQYTLDDMTPTINKDDVVIIKKDDAFNVGDRIMYLNSDSEYMVRTVSSVSTDAAYVACDMCETKEAVQNRTVVGRVVGKISYFGKFINFFKQKWFLITLAVVGFSFVVASQYMHEKPKKIS